MTRLERRIVSSAIAMSCASGWNRLAIDSPVSEISQSGHSGLWKELPENAEVAPLPATVVENRLGLSPPRPHCTQDPPFC